mmetsp:Transcript_9767/g.19148  ORF Transcript_9767/g.19148 Transcript_9767/m.19148 type:complete len:519 (-) Transcript_9767:4516-6072(-)|eukprot:CAMPEP_0204896570 /NCGR_PEP_ID=MMETSP1397-20131031/236_1 /ASSEMBLY_ACC=CAM_ASM_000891 /TAXON_ID=49980 /ORGANISM="Climacostomum Climacostomum virens, Strain Stock W-24" /LENGTH=518 /DNA_ID=CAMNT_0052064199 /DNA_START=919 /DNA_END=2475 /DNA_ORIENTATION=+
MSLWAERVVHKARGTGADASVLYSVTKTWGYGTAGFRGLGSDLKGVCFRCGLVALLRAHQTKKNVGVMITASHNPIDDNGVKLIDWNGEMLAGPWEGISESLVNARELTYEVISDLFKDETPQAKVIIGRDTRPTSDSLALAVREAVEAAGCEVVDYGLVSTPQLHFLVEQSNVLGYLPEASHYVNYFMGKASTFTSYPAPEGSEYENHVKIDAANGVGANVIQHFNSLFFSYEIRNTNPALLNFNCGAEHVQKTLTMPTGFENEPHLKCASFDGDADRLVYFLSGSHKLVLDGSRLIVLYTAALKRLMEQEEVGADISVVSTGYMDGASMRYIKEELNLPLHIEPTGVKYLHAKAKEFNVCIYFEPNGHGTVYVQPQFLQQLSASAPYSYAFVSLANQTVGDAVTNLILAEVALFVLGWKLETLAQLYPTQPGVTTKVEVLRKDLLKVSYDETQVLEPVSLREEVDQVLSRYTCSRALIRASGTEPVIRVFAEADTQAHAAELGDVLCEVVKRHLSS